MARVMASTLLVVCGSDEHSAWGMVDLVTSFFSRVCLSGLVLLRDWTR